MTTLQVLGISTFLIMYYYFVLRTYNTLGLRLFSVCFFVGGIVCYWWYTDYTDLKNVQQTGVATQSLTLKKTANNLTFCFIDQAGKSVTRTQTGGISADELASVTEGQPASVVYNPHSDTVYLIASYRRQLNETTYLLILPGLLFLTGIVSLICLRKYRVYPLEGTIYEYLTDEHGNVLFDDARSSTTKTIKTHVTLTKLLQLFGKQG